MTMCWWSPFIASIDHSRSIPGPVSISAKQSVPAIVTGAYQQSSTQVRPSLMIRSGWPPASSVGCNTSAWLMRCDVSSFEEGRTHHQGSALSRLCRPGPVSLVSCAARVISNQMARLSTPPADPLAGSRRLFLSQRGGTHKLCQLFHPGRLCCIQLNTTCGAHLRCVVIRTP